MKLVAHSVKSNLLVAFRYLLKPLVRLSVKNGLTFPELSAVLKQAYVDIAARQMLASGMATTEEGISLIANIDVGDVRDILSSPIQPQFDHQDQQGSSIAKLLSAWNNNPQYSGPYGVLLDLPFDSTSDHTGKRERSFSDLARETAPGVSPRAVLDECLRIECVISVGDGFYRAVKRSHVPEPLTKHSIGHFAHVVHNVCETCERNLRVESADGKGLFERRIFTDTRINGNDLKEFDSYVRTRGQQFADDIDNWLSTKTTPAAGGAPSIHTGIGVYHYILNDEDEHDFTQTQHVEGT